MTIHREAPTPERAPALQAIGWVAYCAETGGRFISHSEQSAREKGEAIYRPGTFTVEPLYLGSADMLAALEAAVNWFSPPNNSKTAFPLKQICDAIAKARGVSQ